LRDTLEQWGRTVYQERETLQMYTHLVLAAFFPIYIGAHAALHRPPSAAKPEKPPGVPDDDDDEIEVEPVVEGLSPSDAIMFPILAGITLGSLYLIIKWLKDPAILNKILGWYFSALGVVGVGKLVADALDVMTTFVFPSVWASGNEVYYVDQILSRQFTQVARHGPTQLHRKFLENKPTPLPGFLSNIKLSKPATQRLWSLRALFKNNWIFQGYIHGILKTKNKVKMNDILGLIFGIIAMIIYNTGGKYWWLTNLMGFGFAYGSLQLLSPTTFWTGSLLLSGLFVYDITMVFYTPLMVTVATSLDVPIKLVFPGPKRGSMLGLGDIVLPGIMIALALRFDLYLHYVRKQSTKSQQSSVITTSDTVTLPSNQTVVKAPYIEATGNWGERFWTRKVRDADKPRAALGGHFRKTYFNASLVGYFVGIIATLVVLNIYNHAQPALLYLVPGVLIAVWGTALVRGEVGLMWNYTEDGSLEENGEGGNGGEKPAKERIRG
ncbi:signal peptide peptidase-domain-containing protein, partial [Xylogone sp. PMI_703]